MLKSKTLLLYHSTAMFFIPGNASGVTTKYINESILDFENFKKENNLN